MNSHQEWLRTAAFGLIAAIVLGCGIFVSIRKTEAVPQEEDAALTTETAVTTVAQETEQIPSESQYIDLFSSIHMYADGIYPDIRDICMTGNQDDTMVIMIAYDVTNVSDFTVHGAEIAVEVNPDSISDYLTARNYTPYSLTNTYTINPKKMDSYLVAREQLSDELLNELIDIAAGAVTGSSESIPLCSALILPHTSTVFTPPDNSYAGLYGIYSFFQVEHNVRAAFVCPVIAADGSLKSHELTLSEPYEEYLDAYNDLVLSRLQSNPTLMLELIEGDRRND